MKSFIIILGVALLSACSTTRVAEKGKIFAGGEIRSLTQQVKPEHILEREKIKKDKQYFISDGDKQEIIRKSNREIVRIEKEKWEKLLNEYSRIKIPKYDILNFRTEFKMTDFEEYLFQKSDTYKAIQDAKNISNEEISYFLKHQKFIMPTNKFEFMAHYPCVDISDNFKEGVITIIRKVEISSGELSGEKLRNGYQTSISNRPIRMVLDELRGVLKKDTGWMYHQSDCIDKDGNEVKLNIPNEQGSLDLY